MKQPITTLPLPEIQALVGQHVEHVKDNPQMLELWMSIAEYLKDARRWQWVAAHDVPMLLSPEEFRRYVDEQLEET